VENTTSGVGGSFDKKRGAEEMDVDVQTDPKRSKGTLVAYSKNESQTINVKAGLSEQPRVHQ
jgi:selenophosphate synthase